MQLQGSAAGGVVIDDEDYGHDGSSRGLWDCHVSDSTAVGGVVGKITWTQVPPVSLGSSLTKPPCCSTICRKMASPRPVPRVRVV